MKSHKQCSKTFSGSGARCAQRLAFLGVTLLSLHSLAFGQTSVSYPTSPTSGTQPSLSFLPRPKDPDTALSFLINPSDLGVLHSNVFSTTEIINLNRDGVHEDVVGPVDTGGPPIPGTGPDFSYFGALFINNLPAVQHINKLTLLFDAPADLTAFDVDTFLRTNDLQGFGPEFTPTWNISGPTLVGGVGIGSTEGPGTLGVPTDRNLWSVDFTENPAFPWGSINDPNALYPAFTLLSSRFPPGSDVSFSYIPYATTVPEPGPLSLVVGLAMVGMGLRGRRRRP
ncbi:MAG TPA: hypothetical protein VFB21_06485 [Chthonomonadaceae bacterium]|nr:hypothetical protein [Chthonomonadaceae bacterium]